MDHATYKLVRLDSIFLNDARKIKMQADLLRVGSKEEPFNSIVHFLTSAAQFGTADSGETQMFNYASELMGTLERKLTTLTMRAGGWPSHLPMPSMVKFDEWTKHTYDAMVNSAGDKAPAIYIACLAALSYEFASILDEDDGQLGLPNSPAVNREIASYAAWSVTSASKSPIDDAIAGTKIKIEEQTHSIKIEAQEEIDRLRELFKKMNVDNDAAKKQLAQLISETNDKNVILSNEIVSTEKLAKSLENELKQISESVSITKQNISSFSSSIREEFKFKDSKALWESNAKKSTFAFWLSAFTIVVMVVLPVVVVAHWIEGILGFLHRVGQVSVEQIPESDSASRLAASTISRLFALTLPVALYLWLVRLVVRFNMRSLLLADDARQRATMLNVYVRMVERQEASKEDRAVVLAALFRPAPGHGQDNVGPPDFTQLLGKMSGSK